MQSAHALRDTQPHVRAEHPSGVFPISQEAAPKNEAGARDENVEMVVAALKGVNAGHSVASALEAGEIIFGHVFGRDQGMLRARGRKCSSFRKLAAHPDLAMSTSSLWRAVAIYELSLRFPEIVHYVHVGVGHISVVLGLPEVDQFRMLRETEANCWTRRKLQKVATDLRLGQREPGTVPNARIIDSLAGLEMLASDIGFDRRFELMSVDEATAALQLVERIRDRVTQVESRLRSLHHS